MGEAAHKEEEYRDHEGRFSHKCPSYTVSFSYDKISNTNMVLILADLSSFGKPSAW
jgi:hypothetical protein